MWSSSRRETFDIELSATILRIIARTGYRDREKPHSSPLPHHAAYGSVLRGSVRQSRSFKLESELRKEGTMAIFHADRMLDDWAMAWSVHDVDKLLSLFTDDCVYEDVTLGAVNHGKAELKGFADRLLRSI